MLTPQKLRNGIINAKHALDPDSLFNSIYLTEDVVFNKYDKDNNNEVNIITTEAAVYPEY